MNLSHLHQQNATGVHQSPLSGLRLQTAPHTLAAYTRPPLERLGTDIQHLSLGKLAAVSQTYPALQAVLGPKRFNTLVLAFLHEHPSTSFSPHNLGAHLPAWLARNPQLATPRQDLASDVARLEWAAVEACRAATLPPLSAEAFDTLLPNSVLCLQPHLHLLEVRYPVENILVAVRKLTPAAAGSESSTTPPQTPARVPLPRVRRFPTCLAVHRVGDSVLCRRLDRVAFLLLSGIRDGQSIAAVIRGAFQGTTLQPRERASRVRNCFAHASELGWFTETHQPARPTFTRL